MATLATQNIDNNGLLAAYSAAGGSGDKVLPGEGSFVHVKNANAGAVNVTLVTPQTVDGSLDVADRVVAVAAGTEQFIAVPALYRNPADGLADVSCSPSASVTIAALRA